MHDSDHRHQILALLGEVDRRLRLNDALGVFGWSLWGLVGLLLVLKLTGGWDAPAARAFVLGIGAAIAVGFVFWHYFQNRSLAHAAAVADTRADLKDLLKSALFFLGLDEQTDWVTLQIERSAEVAGGLSPSELAPTIIPRPVYYASGTGALLLTLLLWNPGWLQELEEADFLSASQQEQIEHIEELLDEAEALAPEEEKLEELSEALERLRRRDIELTESLQELSEAEDALASSQMDLERLQTDLEELGAQLESTAALSDLSEAMKSQNPEEAAAALRELAKRLADAESSEALESLLESLQNASVQNQELRDMLENLETAAGDLTAEDLAQMAESLESMAEQMENLGQQMAAQQDMEQMTQELQQLQASLGQQQSGQEQQMGQQQQPSGQATQSQTGMMSNQMQMAQMQGDPSSAVPVDAGPAGDTTGPGGGGDDQVLGEATTLEVQLEMEVLSTDEKKEPVPEEIFERLSREEKSTLNYEAVRKRGSYAEESALSRESVPWPYRSLVKRYFLSIVTQSESSSEP